jgi:nicotinate-nucleotide pyrophosphorylase (carboxylating)
VKNATEKNVLALPALECRILGALVEDFGTVGDVTSRALVPSDTLAEAELVAKADGVLCGMKLLEPVFRITEEVLGKIDSCSCTCAARAAAQGVNSTRKRRKAKPQSSSPNIQTKTFKRDAQKVSKGDVVAAISGQARTLLAGERVALNFICHLSGIATQAAFYADKIKHTRAKILDTRKTTPLWRDLEKHAVKCGGAENHRLGLYDMVLIKDNHLALWGVHNPAAAVNVARKKFPRLRVEVEVTDLRGLQQVCGESVPDFVLLDNFSVLELQSAVEWCASFYCAREKKKNRPLLEASGGVNLDNLVAIAETGVDRISIGALTHSVKALDFSLEIKKI